MGRKIIENLVCDVCDREITGDYATVALTFGATKEEYIVCQPRTAPLNPCGNILINKVRALFGNPARLDES